MDVVSSLSRHKLTERNPLRAIVPITAVIWIANWGILVTRAFAMGDGDGLAGVIVRLTVCLIAAATCLLTFKILQHRVMTPAKRFLAAMGCSLPAVIFIAVVHELLWLNYTDYFSKRYHFGMSDVLLSQCTTTGSPCQTVIQQAIFAVGTFIWVYVAWCAFYVVLTMAVDLRERERRLSVAEGMAREAQLSVLRFQLNPHFLFNTLNTLSGLIALDRKGQAEDLVINLSNFQRFSLKSGEEKLVTVTKEIEAQKMYLEIERVRFADRLTIHYDIAENCAQALVPPLLLQPLVENAIKHAVSPSEDRVTLILSAKRDGNDLILTVQNSNWFEATKERCESLGIGMNNIRNRIAALYGKSASLQAGPAADGGWANVVRLPWMERREDDACPDSG
jgi:hypothetical protein